MRVLILLKRQPDYYILQYYNMVITISGSGGYMYCPEDIDIPHRYSSTVKRYTR